MVDPGYRERWIEATEALAQAHQRIEELTQERDDLSARLRRLEMAVRECDSKAEKISRTDPAGIEPDGIIAQYRLSTGPWHRLLALTGTGTVERSEAEHWRDRAESAEAALQELVEAVDRHHSMPDGESWEAAYNEVCELVRAAADRAQERR